MTKSQAIAIFGGVTRTAQAIGVTSSAVSQWRDPLSLEKQDRLRGAAHRLGLDMNVFLSLDAESTDVHV